MAALTGARVFPGGPALERGALNTLFPATIAATNGSGDEFGVSVKTVMELPYMFSLQSVIGGTGSFTSFNINIEISLDGLTWVLLGAMSTAGGEILRIVDTKFRFIRANKTAGSAASGAPTVAVYIVV
jgi:hypothetical protein